jgi:hypothetical protein
MYRFRRAKLFGLEIDTGPVMMEFEAEIKDCPATLRSFREAAIGSGVKLVFRPLSPVRFSLLSETVQSAKAGD